MLTTDQKGVVAEMAIAHAALELGVGVSRPLGDQRRPHFRLRSKAPSRAMQGGLTARRCRDRPLLFSSTRTDGLVRRLYNRNEVDAFAAYCAELRCCYFLPFECVPPGGTVQLRIAKSLKHQELAVR
jgi:hypothetical protein